MDLITVDRFKFHQNWTISRCLVQGQPFGYGVEDEIRQVKVHGETAIPYGRYQLDIRQSPHFSTSFYWNDATGQLIEANEYHLLPNKHGWLYRVRSLRLSYSPPLAPAPLLK